MAINQLQRGSSLERQAILAKVRSMKKKGDPTGVLGYLAAWIKVREPRTKKRPGGL